MNRLPVWKRPLAGAQVRVELQSNELMYRKPYAVGFSQAVVNDLVKDLFAEKAGKDTNDLRRKRLPRQRTKELKVTLSCYNNYFCTWRQDFLTLPLLPHSYIFQMGY